jgi:hypothetical protein
MSCDNFQEINNDLLSYIDQYTNLLTNNPNAVDYDSANPPVYCNFPAKFDYNIPHFAKHNPTLIQWLKASKLILRDAYFTLCWADKDPDNGTLPCPIHIDKPPVFWKINWPILNMENTCIRFFQLKDQTQDLNELILRRGDANSKDLDHYLFKYENFEEFTRHRFDVPQPILMNGQIPHDVGFYADPIFPRIGLQIMFVKEPTHLL